MKLTDRELNNMLDDTAGEIRNETLDTGVVAGATERVWSRLSGRQMAEQAGVAAVDQIRGCDDFQALIPVYLQGGLSAARTMLLEDHTRECVPCRKALKEARYGTQAGKRELAAQKARVAAAGYRMTVVRWGVAAALVAALGLGVWPWVQRFIHSASTLNAIVEAANGNVYKVTNDRTQAIRIGEKLARGERLRTSKDANAVVKLPDGSRIEMRERAEFSVTDSPAGVTINLDRGQVIVQAAKQRDRKLYVQTDDSLVSVKGTIFSVNAGTKGSRVSVIEGEVHVDHAGRNDALLPGQQITTHPSIERVAVKDEVAWSRDAGRYGKMLDEVRAQIDANVAMPGNRYSTKLLDLMPENTVIYVAIPNLAETLGKANQILQDNLQQNEELRGWWEKEQSQSKGRQGFNRTMDLVRQFGATLGDEIVLAATSRQNGEPNEPVILAEVKDEGGLRALLDRELGQTGAPRLRIVGDPSAVASGKDDKTLNLWMNDGVIAFSPATESLKQLATRVHSQARPFAATPFRNHLAGLYSEGAGMIIAADLERLVINGIQSHKGADKGATAIQQLGVTDLRYFVVELKEKDGKPYNRAVVSFQENTHGITSWLAAPNAMGALDFISPDANVVAAFVVKEPTALVDDLLNTLKTADPSAYEQLQKFQTEQGIDLRNDFAAPLGSEYAFAVDGPVLPTPSWKAVFQVDDPARLQQSLERVVEKLNVELAKNGKQGLVWAKVDVGGKTFYTLKSLEVALAEVNYAYAYGYLIAAPSRALVENAIKFKETGHTLTQSAKFKATLPADKQANFSAMVYQNTSSLTAPLANVMSNSGASKETRGLMKGLLGKKAGLAYVYALKDRMVFSVNTEDGPIGLSPSDLLGLPGSSGMGQIFQHGTR